jgi:hypothetical protein
MKKVFIVVLLAFLMGCQEQQGTTGNNQEQQGTTGNNQEQQGTTGKGIEYLEFLVKQSSSEYDSSERDIIEYLHFAKSQHADPNFVAARLRGYLDAHYDYEQAKNADKLLFLMIEKKGFPDSPEQAAVGLKDAYCMLTKDNLETRFLMTYFDINGTEIAQLKPPTPRMALNHLTQTGSMPEIRYPETPSCNQIVSDNPDILEPDGYGLGVHQNEYGQAVTVEPDFGSVPGERLEIKVDAYGPGVHMDQYGRPVRERPWP